MRSDLPFLGTAAAWWPTPDHPATAALLRRALHDEAANVMPSPQALSAIRARVARPSRCRRLLALFTPRTREGNRS